MTKLCQSSFSNCVVHCFPLSKLLPGYLITSPVSSGPTRYSSYLSSLQILSRPVLPASLLICQTMKNRLICCTSSCPDSRQFFSHHFLSISPQDVGVSFPGALDMLTLQYLLNFIFLFLMYWTTIASPNWLDISSPVRSSCTTNITFPLSISIVLVSLLNIILVYHLHRDVIMQRPLVIICKVVT